MLRDGSVLIVKVFPVSIQKGVAPAEADQLKQSAGAIDANGGALF
jgi:hypothetical protein